MVTFFQYLGQVISAADDDWPALVRNFLRARELLNSMVVVLSREGAEPRMSGFFFKAVVKAVFLLG